MRLLPWPDLRTHRLCSFFQCRVSRFIYLFIYWYKKCARKFLSQSNFIFRSVAGIAIGAGLDSVRSFQDSAAVPIMQVSTLPSVREQNVSTTYTGHIKSLFVALIDS